MYFGALVAVVVVLVDTKRTLVKQSRILADTKIEIPHTLTYAEFKERGIRSFSVTLGELTLSDNIQLENRSAACRRRVC